MNTFSAPPPVMEAIMKRIVVISNLFKPVVTYYSIGYKIEVAVVSGVKLNDFLLFSNIVHELESGGYRLGRNAAEYGTFLNCGKILIYKAICGYNCVIRNMSSG